ncbi:hypothetical protein EH220_05415 [bacterium]|nr:MAG: hypothetical protein EH220_05415 [bacterium]
MRSTNTARLSHYKSSFRRVQVGFTLISTMVSFALASVALFGGWVAYRDIQMQWRVANAERQMDQYAHNAMAELVNVLSWSYGAEQIGSGRNMRWQIAMMDQVLENAGQHGSGLLSYRYRTDMYYLLRGINGGRINLTYDRDRGILFDRVPPEWAEASRGNQRQYVWRGSVIRNPRTNLAAFDRRDRMTVVGLELDRSLVNDPWRDPEKPWDAHAVIGITITMQYKYDATHGVSLFTDEYVRERTYSTKVFCRNYDVPKNLFKEDLQASYSG